MIRDDPEALAAFRDAMLGDQGRKPETDNNVIPIDTPQGNSRAYSISRVQRERDADTVEAVIRDDPEALAAFREAMKHQGERPNLDDNVIEVERSPVGNSRAYSISRV